MRLIADMHTHTTYSHGRNSIEEMVQQARKMGLEAITISDHGRSHPLYGVKKQNFKKMREEIDALNQKYDDIDIFLSVESNIIGADGTIDIKEEERQYCDWIYAGYHYVYIPATFKDVFNFMGRNYLTMILPFMRKKTIAVNTQCYLNMMDRYTLKMITHPGDKCPIDVEAVAKKAAEKDVILEINPRHYHLNARELKKVMHYGGKFAINSDAHRKENLGNVSNGIEAAQEAGVPIEQIVNVTEDE
ncbi:MAG: PHP domain-containing protein [Eubacteriaceae bacterium]|jgi:putative hydrolase|nr:PHP domain-containing protein [Eubacteriaceae bacterium]MDD4508106.1 PHP domain-containing protein [Eubacteriaceae bacterium]